jgi:hypothetical protein
MFGNQKSERRRTADCGEYRQAAGAFAEEINANSAVKLQMEEAINHRHDNGDDHDGDYKQDQAASCSHFVVHLVPVSCSAKTRRAGSRPTSPSCRS